MFFTGEPDFKELSSDPKLVASWALPSIKLNFNRKIQKRCYLWADSGTLCLRPSKETINSSFQSGWIYFRFEFNLRRALELPKQVNDPVPTRHVQDVNDPLQRAADPGQQVASASDFHNKGRSDTLEARGQT